MKKNKRLGTTVIGVSHEGGFPDKNPTQSELDYSKNAVDVRNIHSYIKNKFKKLK